MTSNSETRIKQALSAFVSPPTQQAAVSQDRLSPAVEAVAAAAAAGVFRPSAAPGPDAKGRPHEQEDLWRRLRTFRAGTWFCKPTAAGPLECSRRGWTNTGPDLLACEWCTAKLSFPLPADQPQEEQQMAAAQFAELLSTKHSRDCPWRTAECKADLVAFPTQKAAVAAAAFQRRCSTFDNIDRLPPIAPRSLAELHSARGNEVEALLSRPQQADANPAAATDSTADPEPGTPAAVLPRPLPVVDGSAPAVASEGEGSQASAGARVATAPSEDFQRRQRILALTGWTVAPLPKAPSPPSAAVAPAAPGPPPSPPADTQRGSVCAAQAVVFCRICGAKHGLWSFLGVPGPSSNRGTPAAAALDRRHKSVAAAVPPSAKLGTTAGQGAATEQTEGLVMRGTLAAAAPAPVAWQGFGSPQGAAPQPSLGCSRSSGPAVVSDATIAGGAFRSSGGAHLTPRPGPFGSKASGAQVFGLPPPFGGRCPPQSPTPPSNHCLAAGSSSASRVVTTGANTAAAAPPSSAPAPLSGPATLLPGFGSPMQPAFGSPKSARASSGAGSRAAAAVEADNGRDSAPSPAPAFGSAAKSQPAFGFAALRSVSSKRSRSGELATAGALVEGGSTKRPRTSRGPTDVPTALPAPAASLASSPETRPPNPVVKPLDPLLLHRPFCPWVAWYTAADGKQRCGWAHTLDALAPHVPASVPLTRLGASDDSEGEGATKEVPRDRFAPLLGLLRRLHR